MNTIYIWCKVWKLLSANQAEKKTGSFENMTNTNPLNLYIHLSSKCVMVHECNIRFLPVLVFQNIIWLKGTMFYQLLRNLLSF